MEDRAVGTLTFVMPALSMITLLAVAVYPLVSKTRIERRRRDPDATDTWRGEPARDGEGR